MTNPAPLQPAEERELFTLMARGDEIAFSRIFFYYTGLLQPYILSMTRSTTASEEIIQDLFLHLWLNREKLEEIENYRAYIFTASNNRVYTWLKKRAREWRLQQEAGSRLATTGQTTEETIDWRESMSLIEKAVELLPPQKKLIYRLSRDQGLSHDQIAERLGLSKNTVKNHIVEALRLIRKQLEDQQGSALLAALLLAEMYYS